MANADIKQKNGQRIYTPIRQYPMPPRGTEIFIGKLPRTIYEDELIPIFSSIGTLYEFRLMMDFSGSNRGYAFARYTTIGEASKAIAELNGLEIRPGYKIGVARSVDNCRLFLGGIPKNVTKAQVLQELSKKVSGITDVFLFMNSVQKHLNRGYAFVEFYSHRDAAMARRALVPGTIELWNRHVEVDWADPEPFIDEEEMKKVTVLYVRNLNINTSNQKLKAFIQKVTGKSIEKLVKINDFAFVHFYTRKDAEEALAKVADKVLDGCKIGTEWSRPVTSEVYKHQRAKRGSKLLNTQSSRNYRSKDSVDEGIHSRRESECISNIEVINRNMEINPVGELNEFCMLYMWPAPSYEHHKCLLKGTEEGWICRGTFYVTNIAYWYYTSQMHYSMEDSKKETALAFLKIVKAAVEGRPTFHTFDAYPNFMPIQPMQPWYPHIPSTIPWSN